MLKQIREHRIPFTTAASATAATAVTTWYALRGTDVSTGTQLWLILGATFLTAAAAMLCFIASFRPIAHRRLFSMLFLLMAVPMLAALPIGRVPDEDAHLQRIWLLSEGQFTARSDSCLTEPAGLLEGISDESTTHTQLRDISTEDISAERVASDAGFNTGIYPPIGYIPQALAVALARLFTHNRLFLLYAARIGGLLATLALLGAAVHLLPHGKMLLIAVSLLPIALQEEMSASVDGLALGAVSLLIAWVLRHREQASRMTGKHVLQMTVLCLLTVACKMIYAPMILIVLLLPAGCWGGKKKKALAIGIAWGVTLLMSLAWLAFCYCGYVAGAQLADGTSGIGTIMPQLVHMLTHPFGSLLLFLRTIVTQCLIWLHTMLGSAMSALNLPVPMLLLLVEGIGLLLVWWFDDSLPTENSRSVRVLFWVCSLCSILVMLAALYCWWNPYQSAVIEGMQGRYLIPLLLPVLHAMRFRKDDRHHTASPMLLLMIVVPSAAIIARTAALCM